MSTITVITGANKGLGYETARQLITAGHTVWIGARSRDNADRAATELGARAVLIDITDDVSVQAAAEVVRAESGRVDVLVNNAGIADVSGDDVTGPDMVAVLDTNVTGIVRTMHAFGPLLARGRGVVVNVGSGLGSFARVTDPQRMESQVAFPAYNAAKAAVSMLTVQYAKVYPQLRINVVDPGFTATDLNGFTGTQTVAEGAEPIVAAALIDTDGPTGQFFDRDGVVPW
ncbi:SDR family NAD(P)-dependent oxidoreductase [Antrihabitans sp. YC2-6]|uniref:SDR family NAD(P)-dependent oxidoreductase n=1 Tax=Antrihabitans sp. YC2-6 TaxID=2799498 RepID=UPI0018F3B840|nr:SDR family NAD(P)-dependent oxidoreductase [Antrihabitans sp. YC2-6]MBJ8344396.1 SDR family NAD(P)-dependent oxidoreductase [Antrihabitans sp. YC2-6]